MIRFLCPYLKGEVELTKERERHIGERHPDLLPEHRVQMAETLSDPDQVRRSPRFAGARLFSRWYNNKDRSKYVVVVVVSQSDPRARHWIITAYLTRKLAEGEVEWNRS